MPFDGIKCTSLASHCEARKVQETKTIERFPTSFREELGKNRCVPDMHSLARLFVQIRELRMALALAKQKWDGGSKSAGAWVLKL
mmetsp:Transcript_25959/g.39466  ORF Transcript_25959/g.39466 Transcript_25959/m.39466 type:complete len:85 (-) Transcript_25959:20-274(-)